MATTTLPVPKAPTEAAVAEAPEAMLVPPEKVLAPLSVSAPPDTVTVAVLVPVKRLPCSTSAPRPDLVKSLLMLPAVGARVRVVPALATSMPPGAMSTHRGRVVPALAVPV